MQTIHQNKVISNFSKIHRATKFRLSFAKIVSSSHQLRRRWSHASQYSILVGLTLFNKWYSPEGIATFIVVDRCCYSAGCSRFSLKIIKAARIYRRRRAHRRLMNPLLLEYSNEKVTDLHQPARTFHRRQRFFPSNRVTPLVTVSLSPRICPETHAAASLRNLKRQKEGRDIARYRKSSKRRGSLSEEPRIGRGNDRNAPATFLFSSTSFCKRERMVWMINGDSRRGISGFSPGGF